MQLVEVQARVDDWIRAHGGYWDRFQILARLTEELGELSSALQRSQGLRPAVDPSDVNIGEEFGDILYTLAALANQCDVSLEEVFAETLAKYEARDSSAMKNP